MRFLKLAVYALIAMAAAALPSAAASDMPLINIDQIMNVDPLGAGVMTIKMTLTASEYQNWQSRYGQNPSLLKRDLGKYVSQYDTSDWDVQQQQMERKITITCKFRGALLHKGSGVYEFRVPKQWRGGERTGSTFAYNFVQPAGGGGVVQTNIKLILPEAASQFAEDKSESGDRIIRYRLSTPGAGGRALLWAGLVALLAGCALIGVAAMGGKKGK